MAEDINILCGLGEEISPFEGENTTPTCPTPQDTNEGSLGVTVAANDPNKSKVKSIYWQHFDRVLEGDDVKAKCRHCGSKLAANARNGTKVLKNHVEFYCKRLKIASSKQSTIASSFANFTKSVESSTFDQEVSRMDLAKMIAMHEYPLNIVEHEGIRIFVGRLQPLFKMPSRNTTRSDILKLYDRYKFEVAKTLSKTDSRVAITSDMWTSNQKKGYMVVTAHFIDDTWKLQSRIISFTYVPTPHTSDMLSETLVKVLLDWNIDRRLSTITLDNCSTNDAMIDILLGCLDAKYLLLGGRVLHMRCCAHICNLIVKDGLDVVKEGIEKIRASVLYWSATPKRHETFISWCAKSEVLFTKKMVLDCLTRWNSIYLMLESAFLYRHVFPRLRQIEPQYKSLPSDDEWNLAEAIHEKLKVFYKVSNLFSGTQYPTANVYFENVCEIKLAIHEWLFDPNPIIQQMANVMLLKFQKYWDTIHGILGVATILDPRYKMAKIEFYFAELYPADCALRVENIKQICKSLVKEYQQRKKSSTKSSQSEHVLVNDEIETPTNRERALETFMSKRAKTSGRTELDSYFDDDVLPRSPKFDLLMWWMIHGVKYPTLQQIAKDIFAIPVSTVASESAFSTGGHLISPHRGRLAPKTIEALMCLQNWLWASYKDVAPAPLTICDEIEEEIIEELLAPHDVAV